MKSTQKGSDETGEPSRASASAAPRLEREGEGFTPAAQLAAQSVARVKIDPAGPSDSSARISQTFGPYEVTDTLASGGMGSVHLAVQRGAKGFERVVAIKRIHPHLMANRKFCEMFIDEARIASRISHGNVCRIFDFGESPEGYFITMEYLVGEPLSRILRAVQERKDLAQSPRYPLIVARIIAGVAEGLHAAHTLKDDQGERLEVVHRDVSPQNLFVLYDGTVRVTDFGIARARQRLHQTQGELLKGKLSYMAPEQIERKPVDLRVDLWSLGVVLWEALTLRRLFRADNEGETLMRVISKPIPLPSRFNPHVAPALDAIVRGALARDINQRYSSARQMARDLEHVLASSGDTVPAMDLGDWLSEVFPDGAERSSRRLQCALNVRLRDGDRAPVPQLSDDSLPPNSVDDDRSSGATPDWVDPPKQVQYRREDGPHWADSGGPPLALIRKLNSPLRVTPQETLPSAELPPFRLLPRQLRWLVGASLLLVAASGTVGYALRATLARAPTSEVTSASAPTVAALREPVPHPPIPVTPTPGSSPRAVVRSAPLGATSSSVQSRPALTTASPTPPETPEPRTPH